MQKSVTFAFAIHNHQPVGNFDFVNEEAYQKSYLPFLETLARHPGVRIGVHLTGILHEWITAHHPEMNTMLVQMVERGQVQILSGGYYEPILSVIPAADRIGQVEKQNRYIRKHLRTEARGMWLAERVWEPTLPQYMAQAGMEYTVIDDIHFKYAGLQPEQLHNYYVTEDLGYKTNLFPISQELRYLIPFQKPEKTIDYLASLATAAGERVVVFADDGEKFGLWPDTFEHVYAGGWLDRFFTLLEENADWLHMRHFSEIIDEHSPAGTIYLPTASYAEMLHWALPNKAFAAYEEFEATLKESELFEKYGVFVRGGFWRNFFSKYEESNNLHKKMMRVADKVHTNKDKRSRLALRKAESHLWAGQCNCPYWHGVFGGLYLPHLRTAIYENLLAAENIVSGVAGKAAKAKIEISDFDKNGADEVLVETPRQNLYLSLLDGGTLFEHDLRVELFNIHDTMARREEGYHKKLLEMAHAPGHGSATDDEPASIHDLVVAKEADLDKKLFYDRYLPRSMRLHLLPLDVDLRQLYEGRDVDIADFSEAAWELQSKRQDKDKVTLRLQRTSTVQVAGRRAEVLISRTIGIPVYGLGFTCTYAFKKIAGDDMELNVAVDHFFSMLGGAADDRYYYATDRELGKPHLNSHLTLENTQQIGLIDEWKKLNVQVLANQSICFSTYPLETISLSESGFERVYQASAIVALQPLHLSARSTELRLQVKIEKN
jgi:alpha-amylase/alpha-mannosidase (GH57 family)